MWIPKSNPEILNRNPEGQNLPCPPDTRLALASHCSQEMSESKELALSEAGIWGL